MIETKRATLNLPPISNAEEDNELLSKAEEYIRMVKKRDLIMFNRDLDHSKK